MRVASFVVLPKLFLCTSKLVWVIFAESCLPVRLQVSGVIPKVLFYIPCLLLLSPSTIPAFLLASRKHSFDSCLAFVAGKHRFCSCSVTSDTKGVCLFFLKKLQAWKVEAIVCIRAAEALGEQLALHACKPSSVLREKQQAGSHQLMLLCYMATKMPLPLCCNTFCDNAREIEKRKLQRATLNF